MKIRKPKVLHHDIAASYAQSTYVRDNINRLMEESERLQRHSTTLARELINAARKGKASRVTKLVQLHAVTQTRRGIALDRIAAMHRDAARREARARRELALRSDR